MISLNVNIDHTATLRNARGGSEPDPVASAIMAEIAGATGIVCHLREDRRHIKDADVYRLREAVQTKLDLEMAATEEIIQIALKVKPELVTIVPEKRAELTTEGGLNVLADLEKFRELTKRMHDRGIEASYFIEPDKDQIDACMEIGADMVEIHTGSYANNYKLHAAEEFEKIKFGAGYAHSLGLKVAGGHGMNYENTAMLCSISEFNEFSIGHSIMARALYSGIEKAVKDMIYIINTSFLAQR
jgi:pyridoxine 5-phosphate synthase